MPLTLSLSEELERRLRDEARRRGIGLEELLEQDLERRWQSLGGESELLLQATGGLPDSFWHRYREMIALRDSGKLTDEERRELIALSDQAEALTVRRTAALVSLARLRGVDLEVLQKQLGLQPIQVSA